MRVRVFLPLMFTSHLQNSPDDNEGSIIGNPFLQDQSRNIFVIRSRPRIIVLNYFKCLSN